MGRPSVSVERRAQIYDAVIACIKRFGSGGTTLERIAEEAGMSRGHVRHFAGNRDQMMVDAAKHFYGLYRDRHPWVDDGTDHFQTVDGTLDYLFGSDFTAPGEDNALVHQLVDQSRTNPNLRAVLVDAYSDLLREVSGAIARDFPAVATRTRDETAYGVLCIALGNVFMSDIENAQHAVGRRVAEAIIRDLATTPAPVSAHA